jgi:hypothetical protein
MKLHEHPEFPDHVLTDAGIMVYVPLRRKLQTHYETARNNNLAYSIIKCADGLRRKVYHDDFTKGRPILAGGLTEERIFKERGGRVIPGFEDYAIDQTGIVYRVTPYRKGRGRRVPFILHPAPRFSKEYLVLQERETGARKHLSVDKIKELVAEEQES